MIQRKYPEDSQYIMLAYAAVKIHLKIQCILILMFILFVSCKDTNPVLCLIRRSTLVFVTRFIDSMRRFMFFLLHQGHISFFYARFLLFVRKAFENIFPVFCIGFRWPSRLLSGSSDLIFLSSFRTSTISLYITFGSIIGQPHF